MNTIYTPQILGKNFVDKKQKKSRAKQEINDTHMQCSSMRNTPSHVSQTKQKRKKTIAKVQGRKRKKKKDTNDNERESLDN